MAELEIKCVIKDAHGVIRQVRLDNGFIYSVIEIVNAIPQHAFFTNRDYKAWVYKRQNPYTKNWYLTTEPDNTKENNLDFLPTCN